MKMIVIRRLIVVVAAVLLALNALAVTQQRPDRPKRNRPSISSLVIYPAELTGGGTVRGTVTLSGPALQGGAQVALASSDANACPVPSSVTIPAGVSYAEFQSTTRPVDAQTIVTLSATYNNAAAYATISLNPSPPPPPPAMNVYYAAPQGSASGDGTIDNPWDLHTALSLLTLPASSTLYLRGGFYTGKFRAQLSGQPDARVTVTSYPGEWATIDGYKTTTNLVAMTETSQVVSLADGYTAYEGMTVTIGSEMIQLAGFDGSSYNACNRGWNGTSPTAHSVGSTVILAGDALAIYGRDIIYRDFEVMTSDPVRSTASTETGFAPNLTGAGVSISSGADNVKLVNLIIHDARGGVGVASDARDTEVYGCIIYNNGWVSPLRGNGHGLYVQNESLSVPKRVIDCIVFNNYGFGTHAFGESGFSNNIRFEGVVSFDNGSPASYPGNIAGLAENFRQTNLFAGTAVNPPNKVEFVDNHLYHRPGTVVGNSNLGFGYISSGSEDITIRNNHIIGGHSALAVTGLRTGTIENNTLYISPPAGSGQLVSARLVAGYSVMWNANTYRGTSQVTGCLAGGDRPTPFYFQGITGSCGGAELDFSEWVIGTGFDISGSHDASRPTGAWVFIRSNIYESGRAHVIIYNWSLSSSVAVDLDGVLSPGDSFEVRNAQDFFAPPIFTGTHQGGIVSLPVTGLSVAQPIGQQFIPATTGPEFSVLVVIKR